MTVSDLLVIPDPQAGLQPGMFVVLEVVHGRRLLGTFKEWNDNYGMHEFVIELLNGTVVREPSSNLLHAWAAPMGYRLGARGQL